MTKIAVITDAHANLPALEAVLAEICAMGCEAIFHTGDAVGIGPFPNEVLDRLLHTPRTQFVMGNHDELCGFGIPDPLPDWMDALFVANTQWTRAQVTPGLRSAVAAWPYEISETLAGHHLTFLHYPRDPEGCGFVPILADPRPVDLDHLFANVQADVIFYGHHHPAADHGGRARYINPGSLGCGPEALARFTVVELERTNVIAIQHHAVPYDRSLVHRALVRHAVPGHEFVRQTFFP